MNITRENKDALNAVVKIDIEKNDYSEKVEKILTDYRKSANIPGFRKGQVPLGLIKKQYGKAVLVDEVNKLLQESLGKYLNDENHAEFSKQMTLDKIKSDVSNWTIDYDHYADKRSSSKNKKVKLKKIDNTFLPVYINENKSKYNDWLV